MTAAALLFTIGLAALFSGLAALAADAEGARIEGAFVLVLLGALLILAALAALIAAAAAAARPTRRSRR